MEHFEFPDNNVANAAAEVVGLSLFKMLKSEQPASLSELMSILKEKCVQTACSALM